MKRALVLGLGLTMGGTLLATGVGWAIPPGSGQHFDCSDGGTTSCATDDPGCVSNSKGHVGCSKVIAGSFAKAIKGTITCHLKQAEMRLKGSSENGAGTSEENCENNPGKSAQGTLDKQLAAVEAKGICDPLQVAGAATVEAELFGGGPGSLDAQNGSFFCDSTSAALIGDDDAGFVSNTPDMFKCQASVAKAIAKLIATGTKCHYLMDKSFFFKALDFDEEACEELDSVRFHGALNKFNATRDKLVALGICPPCLDGPGMDAIAASALAQLDGFNDEFYPCNLAP
jgi:hypothetical protein